MAAFVISACYPSMRAAEPRPKSDSPKSVAPEPVNVGANKLTHNTTSEMKPPTNNNGAAAANMAGANVDALLADAETKLARAMVTFDPSGKESAAEIEATDAIGKRLSDALSAHPHNSGLLYFRGLAHFAAAASLHAARNNEGVKSRYEKARFFLDKVQDAPWNAEASALSGFMLTQLIGLEGADSGPSLGPKSEELLGGAEKHAPNSPRVMLFRGVSLAFVPAEFGGSIEKSIATIKKATHAFAEESQAREVTTEKTGPHWGQVYALGWLGTILKRHREIPDAKAAWESALALEPDYKLVKLRLLPSLSRPPRK